MIQVIHGNIPSAFTTIVSVVSLLLPIYHWVQGYCVVCVYLSGCHALC